MAELQNLTNTKICYPENELWFIVWNDERTQIMAYGSILPTQCMETPYSQVDYYDNEEAWLQVLLDNGINPFPQDDEENI
jgi:hypothetical protein